jgi:hypothetical protein
MRNLDHPVTYFDLKAIRKGMGRIRREQKYLVGGRGVFQQVKRECSCRGSLADAALSSEEKVAR